MENLYKWDTQAGDLKLPPKIFRGSGTTLSNLCYRHIQFAAERFLLNQAKFRLFLHLSDRRGTKLNSVWSENGRYNLIFVGLIRIQIRLTCVRRGTYHQECLQLIYVKLFTRRQKCKISRPTFWWNARFKT